MREVLLAKPAATARAALPPGPRGALWQTVRYVRNPEAFYLDATARYGDVFTAPSVLGPLVVLSHPADLRTLFALPPDAFGRWRVEAVQPLLGTSSIILSDGPLHIAQRRMIAPTFHREALVTKAARIGSIAQHHLRSWPDGAPFDIVDRLVDLSIDVILQVVFGAGGPARIVPLAEAIRATLDAMSPALMLARVVAPSLTAIGPHARFVAARARLDRLIHQEIDAAPTPDSLLATLHDARDDTGARFGREALRDQLISLVFAGHETSAIGLTWAMIELLRHPDPLQTLRAELSGADVKLGELPYLDAVCRETLRLHPPVPEVIRQLKLPLALRHITLPAGTAVAACISATHRRDDLYPEPQAFRPERFLARRFGPHEFLPFGGGLHRCAGEGLAWLEMKTLLAQLVGAGRFELISTRPVTPRLRSITMGPRGRIMVRLTRTQR